MRNVIIRTIKEIQLRGRFVARKLGMPDWQIHQICLQDKKLIYIPIPKNACTSVKQALHQIEFGCLFDTKRTVNAAYVDVHDFYKKRPNAFTSTNKLSSATDYTRFAVVRDPVGRLISCYRNRVMDLGDLEPDVELFDRVNLPAKPDLNTFVLNLETYRKFNKSIEHHSRPQSFFLRGSLKYLDRVYPMEQLDELHAFLQTISPELEMLRRKSGGTEVDLAQLSQKALNAANRFYKKDYQLLKDFYSPIEKI